MLNVGILGLGTVGQGVVEILNTREKEVEKLLGKKIRVKKILVNDINKERELEINQDIITDNFKEIVEDEEIQLIVEVTSSIEEGYSYIKEGLNKGKDIVTANKAIVSKYFEELTALAMENNVAFLYEASVAGGIPVLKPLKEHLAINDIEEVQGILNGTCNYILTRMFEEGLGYEDVLKEAQDLGYAEADPAADVEGDDTLRKLRILSTLALQGEILEGDIILEGIDRINSFDIEQIKKINSRVKLIGEGRYLEDGFMAIVMPSIVDKDSYFANVDQAFNSVAFKGNNVGELKFYGAGAGKLPTANAILMDVLDIALDNYRQENPLGDKKLKNNNENIKGKFYLRISNLDKDITEKVKKLADKILAEEEYMGIITKEIELKYIYETLEKLKIERQEYFIGRFI